MKNIIAAFTLVLTFSISSSAMISEEEAKELAIISKYRTEVIDAAGKNVLAKYKTSKFESSKAFAVSLLYRADPRQGESLYSEFGIRDYSKRLRGEQKMITREEFIRQIKVIEKDTQKAGLDKTSVTPLLVYIHYRNRNEWFMLNDQKLSAARIFRSAFLTVAFEGSELSVLDIVNEFDAMALEEARKKGAVDLQDLKLKEDTAGRANKSFLKKCDSYGAMIYATYLAFTKEEKEKAIAAFEISTMWNPSNARAHFHKGTMLLQLGRLKEAEASYLESLKHEPSFFFSYYNLACVAALDNRKEQAIKYADLAMQGGYNRYAQFTKDTDLKSIHSSPALAKLIQTYQAKKIEQNEITKYLLADLDQKMVQIKALLTIKNDEWKAIADQALLDNNAEIRIHGLLLYSKYGNKTEKIERLVRSLFDNNGYVNKVAGNALVAIGEDSMPYIELILKSGKEDEKFFARQIKKLIMRDAEAEKVKP